jgi:hypothetical protein
MTRGSMLAMIAAAALAGAPAYAGDKLSAHLGGAGSPDTDGAGHANFTIDTAKNEVCYDLMVEKIQTATAAHVHKGAAGASGPPVVPLATPGADGKAKGCASASAEVVKDLAANPGGYYVNVHNAEHPGGAVRGQLAK